jgi:hypothetical protein
MDLPKKDKYGNSYVSYSQLSTFKNSQKDYYERYILNKPFEGNEYTDFGSKVGEALEKNNFDLFDDKEKETLNKVTRLDEFERKCVLKYEGFYVLGFIDTNSFDLSEIIDYKTGGKKKEFQYLKDDYHQLHLYALALRQETGITPTKASVEFIRRTGNAFKGEKLRVGNELIKTEINISIKNLTRVYWETLRTVKEINRFYKSKI